MIWLDTSFVIHALTVGSAASSQFDQWVLGDQSIGVSSEVWCELFCGPLKVDDEKEVRAFVQHVEPFSKEDAELASTLFNHAGRRRGSLIDCMIAAVAVSRGDELVTDNRRDFEPFVSRGLRLHSASS